MSFAGRVLRLCNLSFKAVGVGATVLSKKQSAIKDLSWFISFKVFLRAYLYTQNFT